MYCYMLGQASGVWIGVGTSGVQTDIGTSGVWIGVGTSGVSMGVQMSDVREPMVIKLIQMPAQQQQTTKKGEKKKKEKKKRKNRSNHNLESTTKETPITLAEISNGLCHTHNFLLHFRATVDANP